jgi:hypothetical protein
VTGSSKSRHELIYYHFYIPLSISFRMSVWFTVIANELEICPSFDFWKCNAFSSTFSTKIVHFLRMFK